VVEASVEVTSAFESGRDTTVVIRMSLIFRIGSNAFPFDNSGDFELGFEDESPFNEDIRL
jgi:hypothetical protein